MTRTLVYGDPEPPHDTEWLDPAGDRWYWDEYDEVWTCDTKSHEWGDLRSRYFPWTLV